MEESRIRAAQLPLCELVTEFRHVDSALLDAHLGRYEKIDERSIEWRYLLGSIRLVARLDAERDLTTTAWDSSRLDVLPLGPTSKDDDWSEEMIDLADDVAQELEAACDVDLSNGLLLARNR
ncbi:MAG: hypothetical protein AAGC53_15690 [Actinomycetota bacterium]